MPDVIKSNIQQMIGLFKWYIVILLNIKHMHIGVTHNKLAVAIITLNLCQN